ncbi:MAG: type II toxin-antitoxin system VapC family toxin [Pirellulaceae bacterium]|nr:type II toxin-antitoxin system VapC family toxin [Pirellulaceae bacterium]
MKFLVDAHTLLWSQDDTTRLSAVATTTLTDPAHDRLVSIATVWEIWIKVAIGKLGLSKPFRVWMDTAITDLAATVLPITLDHVERQTQLEFHHRDPFDRLLIAQSLAEDIPLISSDARFDSYDVKRIWD